MSTTERQSRPRRWVWIVSGAIAVVVILAAVSVYSFTRPQEEPRTQPTTQTATPSTAPGGVDACLAGTTPSADSLLAAQVDAPSTPEGAVSYAAAFARYLLRVPAAADLDEAASWTAMGADEWAQWEHSLDEWTGPRPVSATTVNGSYVVRSYTSDEAVITMDLPWVVDGAISPSRSFAPTVTLGKAAGGNWTLVGVSGSAADDPAALSGSIPFTGGC